MGISITEFLNAFSPNPNTLTNAVYGMHIPVLWTVNIEGVERESINAIISKAYNKNTAWNASVIPRDMSSKEGGTILVAQSVSLPIENSGFSPMMMGNSMGGYLPGYALDARSNFLERSFSVNFIETQTDIIHEFFRPWMIAVGIKGLVEDGQTNLKATMEVRQWGSELDETRKSHKQIFLRGFRFNRVFPTAVEGFTLDYGNTDFPIKSVTFACENYEQISDVELPIQIVQNASPEVEQFNNREGGRIA